MEDRQEVPIWCNIVYIHVYICSVSKRRGCVINTCSSFSAILHILPISICIMEMIMGVLCIHAVRYSLHCCLATILWCKYPNKCGLSDLTYLWMEPCLSTDRPTLIAHQVSQTLGHRHRVVDGGGDVTSTPLLQIGRFPHAAPSDI